MQRFELPIVWGAFAIVAWITLLVGFPFTLQYAREQAPRDVWDSPGFYQMNVHLTLAWALVFTISTVLGALAMVVGYGLMLGVIIPIGGMAFAFIFSKRYPNRFIAQFEVEGRRSGANRPAGAPIEAICDTVRTG
jgi:all-trans-retinol 13,14-reductase